MAVPRSTGAGASSRTSASAQQPTSQAHAGNRRAVATTRSTARAPGRLRAAWPLRRHRDRRAAQGHAVDACAGGRAQRLRHRRRVRRRQARATRRTTASPARGTPLTLPAQQLQQRLLQMLGIPDDVIDATSTCSGCPPAGSRARVDLGRVDGRAFTFAGGMGLDASVVERVDAKPDMKRRFGHWYHREGLRHVPAQLRRAPAEAVGQRRGGEPIHGVSVFFQNGQPYTYFKERPINLTEGARLDSGDLAGVVLRARTRSTCRRCSSARCPRRRCPTTGASRPSTGRARS